MKVQLYLDTLARFAFNGVLRAHDNLRKALRLTGITPVEDEEGDLLHISGLSMRGYLLAKYYETIGKPTIVTAHTTAEDFSGSFVFSGKIRPLLKDLLQKYYQRFHLVLAPSLYTAKLLRNYGIENVIPVSNGIDVGAFRRVEAYRREFREKEGIEEPLIISVGHVFLRKGVDDFSLVAKLLPEYRFYWFGPSYSLLSGEASLVKNRPGNLKFYGPIENIVVAYSSADVFFFPSREENQGLAVLEAMLSGLPSVLRDIPVFEEFQEGRHCLKAKKPLDFALAIRRLVEDEDLARKIAEAGRKRALRHSLERIGARLKTIYEAVLSGDLQELFSEPFWSDPTRPKP